MACECFTRVGELMNKKFRDETGQRVAEVADSGFENAVWVMSAGDHAPVSLKYRFHYYRRRKNGEPESRLTKTCATLMMRYCPFCGTAFGDMEVCDVPVCDGL